jgi:ribosomal protein S27AE
MECEKYSKVVYSRNWTKYRDGYKSKGLCPACGNELVIAHKDKSTFQCTGCKSAWRNNRPGRKKI